MQSFAIVSMYDAKINDYKSICKHHHYFNNNIKTNS